MLKEKYTLRDFMPLIIIFILIIIFSSYYTLSNSGDITLWMRTFMGSFFIIFGLLKVLKLKSFAKAYSEYDLLAMKSTFYSFLYPFIELTLGIFYFTNFKPTLTNRITFIVMLFSALGVYLKLRKKEKIMCACLGTVFKVPMTWVTLFEDLLMAIMALIMLNY